MTRGAFQERIPAVDGTVGVVYAKEEAVSTCWVLGQVQGRSDLQPDAMGSLREMGASA